MSFLDLHILLWWEPDLPALCNLFEGFHSTFGNNQNVDIRRFDGMYEEYEDVTHITLLTLHLPMTGVSGALEFIRSIVDHTSTFNLIFTKASPANQRVCIDIDSAGLMKFKQDLYDPISSHNFILIWSASSTYRSPKLQAHAMPDGILNRDHHCTVYKWKGSNNSSRSEKRVSCEINRRINEYVGMYGGPLHAKVHGIKIFGPDDSDWTESLSFSC